MPSYFDPNLLAQLVQGALQQKQTAQKYSSGFSLAQPKGGFSLASGISPAAMNALTEGKKNVNVNDRLKGMALALSSLAILMKPNERMAPAASMGQKYPVQVQASFPKRQLGFMPILGVRR